MRNGSAIVVTYNSAHAISSCLQAILSSPGWEIVVIDNGSTDETARNAIASSPGVQVVRNPSNAGFAAAANQGEKLASGELLMLLNPDAIAEAGALDELAAALAQQGVGAACGNLLDANGLPQKGFQLRRFPTLGAMLCEVLLLNRFWPGNPWNRRYRCLDLDDTQPQLVEQPAGACLAVRREAWESVAGFDESFYPVWFEDVDFCRRLADRGWKIAYCPEARFSHAGGHSVSKLPFRDRQVFWYSNMLRYFSKHYGRLKTTILRAGILGGLALRSFLSLVGFAPKGVSAREALSGYGHAARTAVQRCPAAASKQSHVGVAAI